MKNNTYRISPVSEYLREITYGGTDGIVTTFAVVAGFTGASLGSDTTTFSFIAVLLFGLANLFADASSMGLGNFLSIRSEKEVYKKEKQNEKLKIANNKQFAIDETIKILTNKGFTKDNSKRLADSFSTNEEYWTDFMMAYGLEMPNPEKTRPLITSLVTFSSFIAFGFVPLLPYIILDSINLAFLFSGVGASLSLITLGLIRWKATNEGLHRAVLETVTLGSVSAIIAFIVGSFFKE